MRPHQLHERSASRGDGYSAVYWCWGRGATDRHWKMHKNRPNTKSVFISILNSEQTNFLQGTDFYYSGYFQLSVNSVLQGGMHTMM